MSKKLVYSVPLILVLALVLTGTVNAELVGWWKLDDGSGNIAVDSSGNGLDGTLEGDPQWVEGYIDGALEFDGDDFVDTGYLEDLATWTIACWVMSPLAPSAGQGPSGPIHREQNYQINWDHSSTTWQGCAGVNVGGWHNASFQPLEADTWYHLTATYDGEALKAFRDGELITTNLNPSGAPAQETNSLKLARHAMNIQHFTGTVDDVKVYNNVLSEFNIRAIAYPNHKQSWKPRPVDGEVDVILDRSFIWNQGIISSETFELYSEHQLYIGTDFDDVNSATEPTVILTDANEYQPGLDYNTTYYWRVDEVSDVDPEPIKGQVWSFTSANFIVLEDFEDYNDSPPDEIWNTWIDGFGDPSNGSTAGYPFPDFVGGGHYVETDNVHGGEQAMPLFYDNSDSGLSEVTKTLTSMRDWTVDDVITLTIFYYGDAGNSTELMFVGVNGTAVVYNEDPRATLSNEWTQWDVPMQKFADQGVDLTNVNTISLGLGDKANPVPGGGEGHVFFDDIRLSRSEAIEYEPEIESVDPGTANLRLYYAFENNPQDTSGRGLNATISGNPTYVNSATGFGMAMNLDGEGDFVTLPVGTLISSLNESSFALWVNWAARGSSWQRVFDFGSGEDINMFLTTDTGGNVFRFAMTVSGNTAEDQTSSSRELTSGWHHIAVTIDPATSTHTLYLDGKLEGQNTSATLKPSDLGVTTQNWIGLSQYAADPYYIGAVDEFRIYNRVLTRPEVLYLAGK